MNEKNSRYTINVNVLNLPLVGELCDICKAQNDIIRAQTDALAQAGAVVMEKEVEEVNRRLSEPLACRDEE